jgi:glycerol-3-phosphate dehydrogenase
MPIEWVQGSHIVVPGKLEHGCYYLESPIDRRVVFALPWQDQIMIGTTEVPYRGDPAKVSPSAAEQDYLLQTLGQYFPAYEHYSADDIRNSFAGLRVLPYDKKRPFSRSRETQFLFDNMAQPRIATIYGGKLTAYRATTERLMKKLIKTLPKRQQIADTRHLHLSRPS